jgi:hypothetical protein
MNTSVVRGNWLNPKTTTGSPTFGRSVGNPVSPSVSRPVSPGLQIHIYILPLRVKSFYYPMVSVIFNTVVLNNSGMFIS